MLGISSEPFRRRKKTLGIFFRVIKRKKNHLETRSEPFKNKEKQMDEF